MFTNAKAKQILEELVGRSSSGNIYFGLSTSTPNRDGTNVTEPSSETGYSRVRIRYSQLDGSTYVFNEPAYDSSTNTVKTSNQVQIMFPEAKSSWGTITHFVIYTSSTGGTPIAYGALTSSVSPSANQIAIIPVGGAVLEIE